MKVKVQTKEVKMYDIDLPHYALLVNDDGKSYIRIEETMYTEIVENRDSVELISTRHNCYFDSSILSYKVDKSEWDIAVKMFRKFVSQSKL